jgi:hypothetical protein
MLTLDLKSDGSPGDVVLAKSLEFNLGVCVTLNGQRPVSLSEPAPPVVDEPHPVLEKDVVQTPATPIPSFADLLNQQVPSAEVTESSP